MRWLFVLLGAVILAAVAVVIVILPPKEPTTKVADKASSTPTVKKPTSTPTPITDPCGTFDTRPKSPYAVTGYWITPKSNPCTWRHQLEQIHKVGGNTVIRIGYGLQYRESDDEGRLLKDGKVDPLYEACAEDGKTCRELIEDDLKRANPKNHLARTYTYRTDEAFGPDLFRCKEMERTIKAGDRVYYLVVAPEDGSDSPTCDYGKQGSYDLIVIAGAAKDSLSQLLDLADQFSAADPEPMKVYPALPLAPRMTSNKTRAEPRHIQTLTTLTRRILQDYGVRFEDRDALGGVYQPFEVQMGATLAKNPTLQVYRSQHDIVEQELEGKPILISPYLDARKRVGFGQTPAQVAEAFKALVKTGVGIIAPQDSRGTGKVGLFWPDQRDEEVDERLRPAVGESTYGDAYHGSTRDYYRAMSEARAEMVEQGYEVELWANVEAFEPSGKVPCAALGTRGQTDKKRLDQAVTMAGRYVQKVVSYMWSDFMTCGKPSVEDEIVDDWQRPITVDAVRTARDGQDGMEVRGYNLREGTLTVTWSGGTTEVPISAWEEANQDFPDGMLSIWVPFDWNQVPAGEWVKIGARLPSGKDTTEPLRVRIQ